MKDTHRLVQWNMFSKPIDFFKIFPYVAPIRRDKCLIVKTFLSPQQGFVWSSVSFLISKIVKKILWNSKNDVK